MIYELLNVSFVGLRIDCDNSWFLEKISSNAKNDWCNKSVRLSETLEYDDNGCNNIKYFLNNLKNGEITMTFESSELSEKNVIAFLIIKSEYTKNKLWICCSCSTYVDLFEQICIRSLS